uniref:Transmembrane protein n=1 Tax=Chromera velia CCMP2878 TaxID=1169474 RepID=A0A0G4HL14_9ALVE|eukprot:Cvel_28643.t1-p1 / transcript=Cvel_28643.t1 / gene=Cvel_28643 / organism=Chromera_velia_CCMP2878 / gene_product=hypothetical protein / transcript_product=hypothetical protein / location=Cvel_scaffold3787:12240-13493(+) / protein_length=418 / sequence_SO=supercontig / SO=protein_coding / is_pseudo=false
MVLSTLRVLSVAVVAASLPAVPLGRHSVREGDREGGASTLEVQAAPQVSAVFRDAFRVERETLGREETPSLPSAPSPFQIVGDGPGSLQSFGWRARGSGGHQGDGQGDIAVSAAVVSEQKKEVTGGWSGWSISDWFPFFGRGREQEGGGGGNHTNAARRGVQRGGNSTWLHHYNRTSDGDGGGQSERNLTEPIEEIDPDSGLLKPVTDFGGPVQGGEGGHVSGYRGRGGEEAESRKATERREREPPSARLSVLEDPGFVQRCMQFLGYVDAHIDHVTSLDPAVVAFTSGMVPEDMHQHERGGGREGMSMSEDPYRPFKGAGAASLSSLSLPFTVSVGFSKPRAVSASDAMTFRLAGPDRDAFNLCVTQMIRPLTGSQRKDRHRSLVQVSGCIYCGLFPSVTEPNRDADNVTKECWRTD